MLSYCHTLVTQFVTIENACGFFFNEASAKSSTGVQTNVHLKAQVKGFPEQKTDLAVAVICEENKL